MEKTAADLLKKVRKQFGYTQEDVAKWIKKDRTNYNKKEKGKVPIFADEFLTILRKFKELGPKKKTAKINDILEVLSSLEDACSVKKITYIAPSKK